MKSHRALLENLQKLNNALKPEGLICTEVPMDGNCGIWSILTLHNNDPFMSFRTPEAVQACQTLRESMAKSWAKASVIPMWQNLFVNCVEVLDGLHSASQKPKQEITTPKKRQIQEPEFIDLSTPPNTPQAKSVSKQTNTKAAKVVTVGEQQAAFPKKQTQDRIFPMPVPGSAPPSSPPEPPAQPPSPRQRALKRMRKLKDSVEKALKCSGAKTAPKDLPDVKDEHAAKQEEEEQEPELQVKKKRRRLRTCKKKVHTMSEKKLTVVKSYLAAKGITWQTSQAYHARLNVNGKERTKDFQALQQGLTEKKMPECLTCLAMMNAYGADLDSLETLFEQVEREAGAQSLKISQMLGLSADVAENVAALPDQEVAADQLQIVLYQGPPVQQEEADQAEQNGQETEVEDDIFAIIKSRPYLQVLPYNTCDKRIPIRCTLCHSARQPLGKVFEGDKLRKDSIENFVNQHCNGSNHLRALARLTSSNLSQSEDQAAAAPIQQDPSEIQMTACLGQCLTNNPDSRISLFRQELLDWARCTKLAKCLQKHTYTFNPSNDELVVRSDKCSKIAKVPDGNARAVCEHCEDTKLGHQAMKSAIRFSLKHWLARVLECRLFKSDEQVQLVLAELRQTNLYKAQRSKTEELLNLSDEQLQAWVRQSFIKLPRECCADSFPSGKIVLLFFYEMMVVDVVNVLSFYDAFLSFYKPFRICVVGICVVGWYSPFGSLFMNLF